MIYFILLFIVVFSYYLKNIYSFRRGVKSDYDNLNEEKPQVSVVIAARNEEKTLPDLLNVLTNQTYSCDRYEVIIANDRSEDRTREVVQNYASKYNYVKLVNVEIPEQGVTSRKKNALDQGIEQSQGEIILSTDADCMVKTTWIEGMVSYFTQGVGLVAGLSLPEYNNSRSFIEQYDFFDMLAMFTAAAGAIGAARPFSCSGQNIAFTKQAFDEVDGYDSIKEYESGDDVLLMQLINNAEYEIRFAFHQKTFNSTEPQDTFLDFINQRIRWATNEKPQSFLNKDFYLFLINALLLNLIVVISLIFEPFLFVMFFLLKSISEYWLINKGRQIFNVAQKKMRFFPIWEVTYPIYAIVIAIGEKLELFEWKT